METTLFGSKPQKSPLKSAFKSNVCQEIVLTETDTNQSKEKKPYTHTHTNVSKVGP